MKFLYNSYYGPDETSGKKQDECPACEDLRGLEPGQGFLDVFGLGNLAHFVDIEGVADFPVTISVAVLRFGPGDEYSVALFPDDLLCHDEDTVPDDHYLEIALACSVDLVQHRCVCPGTASAECESCRHNDELMLHN